MNFMKKLGMDLKYFPLQNKHDEDLFQALKRIRYQFAKSLSQSIMNSDNIEERTIIRFKVKFGEIVDALYEVCWDDLKTGNSL